MRFACSILILGNPVMCDTIEADSAADARKVWEEKFWNAPSEFRREIPAMDSLNADCARKMLVHMEVCRADALKWGITVTARPSRAKTSFGTLKGVR